MSKEGADPAQQTAFLCSTGTGTRKLKSKTINRDRSSKAEPDPAQQKIFQLKIAPDPSRPHIKTIYRYRYGQEILSKLKKN
jgi:hypothetical protein